MVAAAGIGAAVAGAATSSVLSSALAPSAGATANIPSATPTRGGPPFLLNTPTFNVFGAGPGRYTLDPTSASNKYVNDLEAAGNQANNYLTTNILPQVAPGFGALTNAGVQAIRNARDKSLSDLQGNLAQRRILGSSFGQNAVTQTAQSFADQEAQYRAQSFLQELDATNKIIQQRLSNSSAIAKAEIDQLNIETTAGINLMNGTQQVFQDNASVLGQLAAANASGLGAAIAPIGTAVTNAVNQAFTPSPTLSGLPTGTELGVLSNQAAANIAGGAAGL